MLPGAFNIAPSSVAATPNTQFPDPGLFVRHVPGHEAQLLFSRSPVTVRPPLPLSVPPPPPEFVTVTSRAPTAAPLAITSVAVSWVADPTDTFDTVTPVALM